MTLLIGSGPYDSCTGRRGQIGDIKKQIGHGWDFFLAVFYILWMQGVFMLQEVKRGQIYYANFVRLTPEISSEQFGMRPVLVLQNDVGNLYSPTTIVAAMSTRVNKKHRLPTHVIFKCDVLPKESVVLLEQVRTIDKKRFIHYVGEVSSEVMWHIDQAMLVSFGISYKPQIPLIKSPIQSNVSLENADRKPDYDENTSARILYNDRRPNYEPGN